MHLLQTVNYNLNACYAVFVSMYFLTEWKTVDPEQKPAELDLQCFKKENKSEFS